NRWYSTLYALCTVTMSNGNKRVETQIFEIHKHHLHYDDVMNKHREVVYVLRNKMLDHGDPREEVESWIDGLVAARLERECEDRNHPDTWNLKALADDLAFAFRRPVDLAKIAGAEPSYDELEDKLTAFGREAFHEKIE